MRITGMKYGRHGRRRGTSSFEHGSSKLAHVRGSSALPVQHRSRTKSSPSSTLPLGATNENPRDIGLFSLIAEDFRTHEHNPLEPGFWAVALHRLGNARMSVRPKLLRAPLTLGYRAAFHGINWAWGIDLSYTVKLGRRVRIWHHGCIVLNARAIGDDVHIRHSTTLGVARRSQTDKKPSIGNGVDIGVGACVLGDIEVGDGCVIGANAVVLDDLPAYSTAVGAPARPVHASSVGHSADARRAMARRRFTLRPA
jgi:serine O-acetyltransferase